MRKARWVTVVGVCILGIGALVLVSSRRSSVIWQQCVGKKLADCVPPAGFTRIERANSYFVEKILKGDRDKMYHVSKSTSSGLGVFPSVTTAILEVDSSGTVMDIDVQTQYGFP